MPSEAEELAARLVRLKAIIESLESECSQSTAAQAQFDKLKTELDEIRRRLKRIQSP